MRATNRTCLYCDEKHHAKGLCRVHYHRLKLTGAANTPVGKPRGIQKPRHVGCSVDGCDGEHHAHGMCRKHGERMKVRGTTDPRPKVIHPPKIPKRGPTHSGTPIERAYQKIDVQPNGCWIWTSAVVNGTPVFGISAGVCRSARRYLIENKYGPVASKYTRSTCGDRMCVRPEHSKYTLVKDVDEAAA